MRKIIAATSILFSFLLLTDCGKKEDNNNNNLLDRIPTAAEVSMPFFTVLPMDQMDFLSLTPLGNLNPPGHTFPTDHHYLYLTAYLNHVTISAPGKIWLTEISSSLHHNANITDYSITFYPCRQLRCVFGHVSSLSAALVTKFDDAAILHSDTYSTGGETYTMVTKSMFMEIEAGTLLGTAGGNAGQYALDFGVYDSRVKNNFANPSRYNDSYLQATSCLDYFSDSLQSILRGRCGNYNGSIIRTIEPVGGTIAQDIAGTAQGNWFVAGRPTYPEDPHLALVHDNVDPRQPRFSVGTSIPGLSSGCYGYTVEKTGIYNRDFSSISADGKIYVFRNISGLFSQVILIQLMGATSLRIEAQDASDGPPWNFTDHAMDFVR